MDCPPFLQSDACRACVPPLLLRGVALFEVPLLHRVRPAGGPLLEQVVLDGLSEPRLIASTPCRTQLQAADGVLLDDLPHLLFPSGGLEVALHAHGAGTLPSKAAHRRLATVAVDVSRSRTYITGLVRYWQDQESNETVPVALCAWSSLPDVFSPGFLDTLAMLYDNIPGALGNTNALPDCAKLRGAWGQGVRQELDAFAQMCAWLVYEVPAPPFGSSLCLHGMAHKSSPDPRPGGVVAATRPLPQGLPHCYVPLQVLLSCLGVTHLLLLLRLLLLERQVLLRCSSALVLTYVCEALAQILLFPLAWQHDYVPLLSDEDELGSRSPWLFGLQRQVLELGHGALTSLGDGSLGVSGGSRTHSVFDLDLREVDLAIDVDYLPDLPLPVKDHLEAGLEEILAWMGTADDFTVQRAECQSPPPCWWPPPGLSVSEQSHKFNLAVQRVFFHAIALMLSDVCQFVGYSSTALSPNESNFDVDGFIACLPEEHRHFCTLLVDTVAFHDFVEVLRFYGYGASPFEAALQEGGFVQDGRFDVGETPAAAKSGTKVAVWASVLTEHSHQNLHHPADIPSTPSTLKPAGHWRPGVSRIRQNSPTAKGRRSISDAKAPSLTSEAVVMQNDTAHGVIPFELHIKFESEEITRGSDRIADIDMNGCSDGPFSLAAKGHGLQPQADRPQPRSLIDRLLADASGDRRVVSSCNLGFRMRGWSGDSILDQPSQASPLSPASPASTSLASSMEQEALARGSADCSAAWALPLLEAICDQARAVPGADGSGSWDPGVAGSLLAGQLARHAGLSTAAILNLYLGTIRSPARIPIDAAIELVAGLQPVQVRSAAQRFSQQHFTTSRWVQELLRFHPDAHQQTSRIHISRRLWPPRGCRRRVPACFYPIPEVRKPSSWSTCHSADFPSDEQPKFADSLEPSGACKHTHVLNRSMKCESTPRHPCVVSAELAIFAYVVMLSNPLAETSSEADGTRQGCCGDPHPNLHERRPSSMDEGSEVGPLFLGACPVDPKVYSESPMRRRSSAASAGLPPVPWDAVAPSRPARASSVEPVRRPKHGGGVEPRGPLVSALRGRLCELQACDPSGLHHEEQLAFWLNVLNAAALAWLLFDDRSTPTRGAFFLSWLQKRKIDVGGHEYSLHEIEHMVLRSRSNPPSLGPVEKLFWMFSPTKAADDNDPRAPACLRWPAPEVSFGIAYPTRAGLPEYRVYRPETVKAQLLLNCAHMLAQCPLQIDAVRRRLTLPGLFRFYARDFADSDAELIDFARSVLLAVPSALEATQRLLGGRASSSDEALAAESGSVAAQMESLRATSRDFCTSNLSGGPSFTGAAVRFQDMDWSIGRLSCTPSCPELEAATRSLFHEHR